MRRRAFVEIRLLNNARVACHIGYHKTATTWLQHVAFTSHSEVVPYLPRNDFTTVVSDPFVQLMLVTRDGDYDAQSARSLFTSRVASLGAAQRVVMLSAERLSGHAASGGYDAERIAARLHAAVPEAKVFWMVRHQAEAIRSEYKQIVRAGWTGSVPATLAPERHIKTVGFDFAYWEYDRLAATYSDLFGAENVKLFDYNAFADDPAGVLDALATFLGIVPWSLSPAELALRRNPSDSDRVTRIRQCLNQFTRSELNPYPPLVLPARTRNTLLRMARRLPGSSTLFDPDFTEWAEARFAESNARLRDRWGLTLTSR